MQLSCLILLNFIVIFAVFHINWAQNTCYNTRGLSSTEKDDIVYWHNYYRQQIANGSEGLKTSLNMTQIQWDDEIAGFAQTYVDNCPVIEKDSRKTPSYDNLGENIFAMQIQQNISIGKFVTNYWHDSIKRVDNSVISNYTQFCPITAWQIQMIWAQSTRIGCGYVNTTEGVSILICDYQKSIEDKKAVQTLGKPCTACSYKCSETWNALCEENLPKNTTCSTGWIQSNKTNACRKRICPDNCFSCDIFETICDNCSEHYILESGKCRKPICSTDCLSCEKDATCAVCKYGYYLSVNESNTCKKCLGNCSACLQLNSSLCTDCANGTYLKLLSNSTPQYGNCISLDDPSTFNDVVAKINNNSFQNNLTLVREIASMLDLLINNAIWSSNITNQSSADLYSSFFESQIGFMNSVQLGSEYLKSILSTKEVINGLCTAGKIENQRLSAYQKSCTKILGIIKSGDFSEKGEAKTMIKIIETAAKTNKNTLQVSKKELRKSYEETKKAIWKFSAQNEEINEIIESTSLTLIRPKPNETGSVTSQTKNLSSYSSIGLTISNSNIDLSFELSEINQTIAAGMLPNLNNSSNNTVEFQYPIIELNALNLTSFDSLDIENKGINASLSFLSKTSIDSIRTKILKCLYINSSLVADSQWIVISQEPTIVQGNNDAETFIKCSTNHFSFFTILEENVPKSSTGVLIGVLIGCGLAVLLIAILGYFLWRRCCKAQSQSQVLDLNLTMSGVEKNAHVSYEMKAGFK